MTLSNNSFCGNISTSNAIQCPNCNNPTISQPDSCNVCGGNNESKDCDGVCFGTKISGKNLFFKKKFYFDKGKNGDCCYACQQDCDGNIYYFLINLSYRIL